MIKSEPSLRAKRSKRVPLGWWWAARSMPPLPPGPLPKRYSPPSRTDQRNRSNPSKNPRDGAKKVTSQFQANDELKKSARIVIWLLRPKPPSCISLRVFKKDSSAQIRDKLLSKRDTSAGRDVVCPTGFLLFGGCAEEIEFRRGQRMSRGIGQTLPHDSSLSSRSSPCLQTDPATDLLWPSPPPSPGRRAMRDPRRVSG